MHDNPSPFALDDPLPVNFGLFAIIILLESTEDSSSITNPKFRGIL